MGQKCVVRDLKKVVLPLGCPSRGFGQPGDRELGKHRITWMQVLCLDPRALMPRAILPERLAINRAFQRFFV